MGSRDIMNYVVVYSGICSLLLLYAGADTGGGGGQRGLLTPPPLQKFLVYQDRDTLIEQSL